MYDDWTPSSGAQIRIQRLDTAGQPRGAFTKERVAKKYGVAAKMLVGRINTWFAFPEWFTYKEPVNTLTVPKSTPGGLASQFSSIGHYDLADDQAMIVTVPVSNCAYQAIQIGSRWYISTDYEHHQTSLSRAQSHADPDGRLRYVVSGEPRHRQLARDLRPPAGPDDAALAAPVPDLTSEDGPASRWCRSTRSQSASPTSRRTRFPPMSTLPESPTARSASPEG